MLIKLRGARKLKALKKNKRVIIFGENHNPSNDNGFLLIFRERLNNDNKATIHLNFLQSTTLSLQNVLTDEKFEKKIGENGKISLEMEQPGNFLFLKYITE